MLGVFFVVTSNIFALYPAQYVRKAFDTTKEVIEANEKNAYNINELTEPLLYFGLLIIAFALLKGVFMFFMRQTIIVMSRKIEFDLKNEIYKQYQSLSMSFYKKTKTGDLMNRISEDVSKVRMYLGPALMYGMNVTILMLIVIPFMFYINSNLAFYSLVPLPFLVICIYFVQNIINRRSEEIQKSLSNLSTYVQETFSGIRLIKSFVREVNFSNVFTDKSNDYKDKSIRLQYVLALFFPVILSCNSSIHFLLVHKTHLNLNW